MIRFKWILFRIFLVFSVLMIVASCEKELDKYYEVPDWLKGNVWEVLSKSGEHSLFLEAIERAGYKEMISGRGIITVVAPDDNAFHEYLNNKGYGSVGEIAMGELRKMVGYHIVYYAFDQAKFANYRPEGSTAYDEQITDAGLYFKFRTKSATEITEYRDFTVPTAETPPLRKVYHKERFLPVLSSYLFDTKGIDPIANYEYFYSGSNWTGEQGRFNISNASVREYGIIADNGYVYVVDQVLEPLETIYNVLDANDNFSIFKEIYDRFIDFQYNEDLSQNYGQGDSLFLYYHVDLPKIASEWSYNGEGGLPDYADLATLSRESNNVFAPINSSILDFYDSFWSDYYDGLESVHFLPIKYLLDNHVHEGDIVFPEEINRGRVITKYGNPVDFNPEDVSLKAMCNNGTLYGLDNLMVPRMFESVTASAFQRPEFRMFLHMMDQTSMVQPLMSEDFEFNMFLPDDHIIQGNSSIEGRMMLYQNLNPNKFGMQSIQIEGDDVPWTAMNLGTMTAFVRNHVTNKMMTKVDNLKVLKTLNSFQYLLVEDDQFIYSSDIYNNYKDSPSAFTKITEHYNGTSLRLTGTDDRALTQDFSLFKNQLIYNTPSDLSYFEQLCRAGGFLTSALPFSFLLGERFIVFAPTEEAILDGFASIPSQPSAIGAYMRYYFVSVNESRLGDYPFPGAGIEGELITYGQVDSDTRAVLTLIDNGDQLQVMDAKGNIVNVLEVFPRIYGDGAVYMIDGLLEFQ